MIYGGSIDDVEEQDRYYVVWSHGLRVFEGTINTFIIWLNFGFNKKYYQKCCYYPHMCCYKCFEKRTKRTIILSTEYSDTPYKL